MAAAISYYTIFAIVPLAMFVVSLFGLLAGSENVQEDLADNIAEYIQLEPSDVVLELEPGAEDAILDRYGAEALGEIEAELSDLNETDARQDERSQLANDLQEGQSVTIAGHELGPEELAVRADNLIAETLRNVVQASGPVSILSFLIFAYAASGWVGALRRSLDFVWDVGIRRPLVPGKIVDFLGVLSLGLLLALFVAVATALRTIQEVHGDLLGFMPVASRIFSEAVLLTVPWACAVLFCLVAYRYGPTERNRLGDVWLGALLAATGFMILVHGYGFYIANFGAFDVIYGALGGVLLFMLVVNLSAYVFLFCAEVSAEYPRVRRGDYDDTPSITTEDTSLRQMAWDGVRSLFTRKKA